MASTVLQLNSTSQPDNGFPADARLACGEGFAFSQQCVNLEIFMSIRFQFMNDLFIIPLTKVPKWATNLWET